MAKERTEKSKYPSRYSPGGFVTAAQYVVEMCCEKKAKKEKKDLPTQFWQLPEWQKFYKSQVNSANKLIKTYGELAVIAALKDKRSSWMYSLRCPGFDIICAEEKLKVDAKQQIQDKSATRDYDAVDTTAIPQRTFSSAYLGDKLRDL